MEVERFHLPAPDTRLLIFEGTVYKVKLRQRGCADGEDVELKALYEKPQVQKDLKKVVLYTLANITDSLHPIQTDDLVIYPYKSRWKAARKLNFYQHDKQLDSCPEVLTLYVEWKQQDGNVNKDVSAAKRNKTDNRDDTKQEERPYQSIEDKENQTRNRKQKGRKQRRDQDRSPRPKRKRRVVQNGESDSDNDSYETTNRQPPHLSQQQWVKSFNYFTKSCNTAFQRYLKAKGKVRHHL